MSHCPEYLLEQLHVGFLTSPPDKGILGKLRKTNVLVPTERTDLREATVVTLEDNFLQRNEQRKELLGFEKEQCLDVTFLDFIPTPVHPAWFSVDSLLDVGPKCVPADPETVTDVVRLWAYCIEQEGASTLYPQNSNIPYVRGPLLLHFTCTAYTEQGEPLEIVVPVGF